jgi:hypothetical protein
VTRLRLLVFVALAVSVMPAGVRAQTAERDGIGLLLRRLELALRNGSTDAYEALLVPGASRAHAREFMDAEIAPGATRALVQERIRDPLPDTPAGEGYRLIVQSFVEYGERARIGTWRVDVRRAGSTDADWQIVDQEHLTSVENLYHLSLETTRQFAVHELRISSEDIELTVADGAAFAIPTAQGFTGLVLLGRGMMRFHPAPETERGQVKVFCGAETLEAPFEAAFVRLNPAEFEQTVGMDHLVSRTPDPRDVRRAQALFLEEAPKSFGLDVGDLSRDSWSLLPQLGDFLAEIHTRRYGTLTYARAAAEAEDITLFDRKLHRNIALYASAKKLEQRGRFYADSDSGNFDALDYDIDLSVDPVQGWLQGLARVHVRIRSAEVNTLTLRLADPMAVRWIVSDRFGPLFSLRVLNQNSIIVTLPAPMNEGDELVISIAYAGHLEPQSPDNEALQLKGRRSVEVEPQRQKITGEPSYLYSSRDHWYPRGSGQHYATAVLRLTIPAELDCVATGELAQGSPTLLAASGELAAQKSYVFSTTQPVRYLAFLISRLVRLPPVAVAMPADGRAEPEMIGQINDTLNLMVETQPDLGEAGRIAAGQAIDILRYYASILGDCPYASLTLAVVEGELPGGHSPAYFTQLNQVLPGSVPDWRNDPAAFPSYPEFVLAHELAHQWWGQAVGWRNYHEQWLSEAFSLYFAALYAEHHRGQGALASVLRQLRNWSLKESDEGPVYLGYRAGHIRNDSRIFRAIVYDKGAAVLHMLRRLVGDEAFFRAVRRFYRQSRFRSVGTEELRLAMETEAGRPLTRFFEAWIYGSKLPRLRFSYRVETGAGANEAVLHVEQLDEVFDLPLTVTLRYAEKKPADVIVPVTERSVDVRIPLAGPLRRIDVREDDGTLAEIVK